MATQPSDDNQLDFPNVDGQSFESIIEKIHDADNELKHKLAVNTKAGVALPILCALLSSSEFYKFAAITAEQASIPMEGVAVSMAFKITGIFMREAGLSDEPAPFGQVA
jgi:hypothetical protein